jgi:hypothetical protein
VLESWEYRWLSGSGFVLRHLRFIKVSLPNYWLRKLVLRVVSGPGEEVGMAYWNQYIFLSVLGYSTYRLGNNGERLPGLPEYTALGGHPFSLHYLTPNEISQKKAAHVVPAWQVKASALL